MRWKMMKEDPGVSSAQAWGCPHSPQGIFKDTQASKLGDAPVHPFSTNNHHFVHLHAIFLSLHMLCAMLGASHSLLFSLFQFFLLFITSWKLAYLFRERNMLHSTLEHNIGFHAYLFCVFFFFSQLLSCLALSFHAYLFKSYYLVASGTLLSYHAYLVQRVGSLH